MYSVFLDCRARDPNTSRNSASFTLSKTVCNSKSFRIKNAFIGKGKNLYGIEPQNIAIRCAQLQNSFLSVYPISGWGGNHMSSQILILPVIHDDQPPFQDPDSLEYYHYQNPTSTRTPLGGQNISGLDFRIFDAFTGLNLNGIDNWSIELEIFT